MAKRKKRVLTSKKKKTEGGDEALDEEEAVPSAKKVAASSTSCTDDDASQASSFNSIGTSEGTLGFSSHFWCNYCEFSADTKQELVTHMRQHMIKCSFCTFSSLSRAEVLRHVKGEHDDEMEVDSSSSVADHDMDKDPCCACIFCDFMTYSTEYLEQHTTSKHRGMLPKSVAKMISKAVSAKVRKADALFYSTLSTDGAEASHPEKEPDAGKFELPSSSDTIVIEEQNSNNSSDVKPHVKDLHKMASEESIVNSDISSCGKLNPVEEEHAEKIVSGIDQTISKLQGAIDWKVKVETMYCLSCPYSNVAVDKLKCHTFSQHPKEAAVAKNNSSVAAHDLPDVTFFCVQESCNHSTNTCIIYEEHMMSCCPVNQNLLDDVVERLKSTLKFLSEFHYKHSLKAAPGFLDYVSSFNKFLASRDTFMKFPVSDSFDKGLDASSKSATQSNSSPSNIVASSVNQHHTDLSVDKGSSSSHPSLVPSAVNPTNTQPVERSMNAPTSVVMSQNNTVSQTPDPSHFRHQNDAGNQNTQFQAPITGIQDNTLPQPQSQSQSYGQSFISNTSQKLNQSNFIPPSHYSAPSFPPTPAQVNPSNPPLNSQNFNPGPMPNTFQSHQEPQFRVQGKDVATNFHSNNGTLPMNTSFGTNTSNTSTIRPQVYNAESFLSSNPSLRNQPNMPFSSTPNLPCPLPTQQFQQSGSSGNGQIVNPLGSSTNPPKMMDLLSDSYSILLDNDLNMVSPVDGPIPGLAPQQPAVSNTHGPHLQASTVPNNSNNNIDTFGAGAPGVQLPSNIPQDSIQQSAVPPIGPMQGSTPQQPAMSYPCASQAQQVAVQGTVPHLPDGQGVLPPPPSGPKTPISTMPDQITSPFSQPMPESLSHTYVSSQGASNTVVSAQQYANINVQQITSDNSQQSHMVSNQFPSSSPTQFQPQPALSAPMAMPSSSQGAGIMASFPSQQHEAPISPFQDSQSSASPSVPGLDPVVANVGHLQTASQISEGQNLNPSGHNSETGTMSFLETPSSGIGSNSLQAQNWQGNQSTSIPNFLVPSSHATESTVEAYQPDANLVSTPDGQSRIPANAGQGHGSPASHVTPVKNQPMNIGRNFAGNSPLSPSIYLNGQAPRHNRSDWTNADMMARGASLPPIRQRPAGPMNFPNAANIRQNLFPPRYRGRGRPRGPRMQNRFPNPPMRSQDDDVIVTAVVRGPPPQQPPVRPLNRRGMARGQRRPMPGGPGGPGRGMVRHPGPAMSRKPFDVSKHFVDLACVVNTANDEDFNDGEDDIQIMGVTPGSSASKGPPKVVDAKKFSFCCVHCGKDQGSKQVMKQHMKANHNDSLLGAFRNVETGQFLFFCPQLRCEFMTYDEARLTEHLYSCYNLDKSKQLPFDLQSALKNLRSLKIRKVNTNVATGGSQTNPIDLDGQGLRDTFNNNLTDAFDDMVEGTIGRYMTRPNTNSQPVASSPMTQSPGRGIMPRPQRGRPIGGNIRMPRPHHYQPRQPHTMQRHPGQYGDPRMPGYPPSYRARGRRNFRQGPPPQPMRGSQHPQMMRPAFHGQPPNPRAPPPFPNLGNEQAPILIDVDLESSDSTPESQNMLLYASNQSIRPPEPASISTEVSLIGSTAMSVTTVPNAPLDSSLTSSSDQNMAPEIPNESDSAITSLQPQPLDNSTNPSPPAHMGSDVIQSQTPDIQTMHPYRPIENAAAASPPQSRASSGTSVSHHSVSEPLLVEEGLTPDDDNEEEQVNAILLEKVFAKVPHMPKKLSQRLVLRFKEFAAKRGVVITPNSKVIDEFVERISYKGSNPLSKQQQPQQQQPHQQQPQELQHPQQYPIKQQQQFQQHQSSLHKAMPNPSDIIGSNAQPVTMKTASMPVSQNTSSPGFDNIPTAPGYSQHQYQSNAQQLQDQFSGSSQHDKSVSSQLEKQQNNSSQTQDQPQFSESQNLSRDSQSPNRSSISQSQNYTHVAENQSSNCATSFDLDPNQPEPSPRQNKKFETVEDDTYNTNSAESVNPGDCDIIETKIILAERDLKFSGVFANIARSVFEQGKKAVKSEHSWSPSTSPNCSSSSDRTAPVKCTNMNIGGALPSAPSPNHPVSSNLATFMSSSRGDGHSPLSFREQLSVNEKMLKKESIPMAFPATGEGETIMVQSSVDHLVSGNESLEVDIAGKPLYGNNMFPEAARTEENVKTVGKQDLSKESVEVEKDRPKVLSVQEHIIDKTSGKIILKVKKGDIPRKKNDASTSVVPNTHDNKSENLTSESVESESQFVRRSERKRKVRHCEEDEDSMNELDNLLSDDDDEYQVESDDDSYDENEYGKGYNGKKKSKAAADPNAFNVRQRGTFLCWICLKKFVFCLGVKKHILQKHSKALCAIAQEEAEDISGQRQLQLLLFCHRHCKFATVNSDAHSCHVASCHKTELVMEGQDIMEIQIGFLAQQYLELQEGIASGSLLDQINQASSRAGKRKRQASGNASSAESQKEMDNGKVMNTPAPIPPQVSETIFDQTTDITFYPSIPQ